MSDRGATGGAALRDWPALTHAPIAIVAAAHAVTSCCVAMKDTSPEDGTMFGSAMAIPGDVPTPARMALLAVAAAAVWCGASALHGKPTPNEPASRRVPSGRVVGGGAALIAAGVGTVLWLSPRVLTGIALAVLVAAIVVRSVWLTKGAPASLATGACWLLGGLAAAAMHWWLEPWQSWQHYGEWDIESGDPQFGMPTHEVVGPIWFLRRAGEWGLHGHVAYALCFVHPFLPSVVAGAYVAVASHLAHQRSARASASSALACVAALITLYAALASWRPWPALVYVGPLCVTTLLVAAIVRRRNDGAAILSRWLLPGLIVIDAGVLAGGGYALAHLAFPMLLLLLPYLALAWASKGLRAH